MPVRTFSLPVDANNKPVSLVPDAPSVAGTTRGSLSAAGTHTFNTAAELMEITALGQGIYFKYGTAVVTSSNMDGFVPTGQTRQYAIPAQRSGTPGARFGNMTLIEAAASGTAVIIEY